MNSTTTNETIQIRKSTSNATRILNVAFDVGSESLNWSTELGGQAINDECRNDSHDIRQTLGRIMNEANE